DEAQPRLAQRPGRDAVELGQHAAAVVGYVVQHRPAQAGERYGLLAALGLQLEGPRRHDGEAVRPVGPPGHLPELYEARQLAGGLVDGAEGGRALLEVLP